MLQGAIPIYVPSRYTSTPSGPSIYIFLLSEIIVFSDTLLLLVVEDDELDEAPDDELDDELDDVLDDELDDELVESEELD